MRVLSLLLISYYLSFLLRYALLLRNLFVVQGSSSL
jgi:hypothetical protein